MFSAAAHVLRDYGEISASAKKIPFAISCGEKDAAKSFSEAPYTRIEWYGRFRDEIEKKKFCHIAASWPGVGHNISPGAWDLARQCFQLATGLPGISATEEVEISAEWKNLDGLAKNAQPAKPAPPSLAAIPEATARAAFMKADAGEIPADKLLTFMRKYPPILWKDKPGSEKAARTMQERGAELACGGQGERTLERQGQGGFPASLRRPRNQDRWLMRDSIEKLTIDDCGFRIFELMKRRSSNHKSKIVNRHSSIHLFSPRLRLQTSGTDPRRFLESEIPTGVASQGRDRPWRSAQAGTDLRAVR